MADMPSPSVASHVNARSRAASLLAFAGGLVQILVVPAILFLPLFQVCQGEFGGRVVCEGRSYVALGGNALGYTLLTLMLLGGAVVIVTSRNRDRLKVAVIRGLVAILSLSVVVVGGWSFGLAFAPSALLLFIAAVLT